MLVSDGPNALDRATIKCPDDGPNVRDMCHIDSTSDAMFQFYQTQIEAVEGFKDFSFTCDAPGCISQVDLKCGENYEYTCRLNDSPSPFTTCGTHHDGDFCESFTLAPDPVAATTSDPTTANPTTMAPTTSDPTEDPTNDPTNDPTEDPTTADPTGNPTNEPTTASPTSADPTTATPTTMQPSNVPSASPVISLGVYLTMYIYIFC